MIILWSSYDHLMIILWSSYDHLMIILWSSYNHLRIVSRTFYNHLMITFCSSYNHLRIVSRSFYNHLMITFWSFYNHLKNILRPSYKLELNGLIFLQRTCLISLPWRCDPTLRKIEKSSQKVFWKPTLTTSSKMIWAKCYKTFYASNLRVLIIS